MLIGNLPLPDRPHCHEANPVLDGLFWDAEDCPPKDQMIQHRTGLLAQARNDGSEVGGIRPSWRVG